MLGYVYKRQAHARADDCYGRPLIFCSFEFVKSHRGIVIVTALEVKVTKKTW